MILVLGARLEDDGTPGRGLASRLERAAELAAQHPEAGILLSGGGAGPSSEAEAMKRWMLEHGVEASRIVLEDRSKNTRENMLFSLPLLVSTGAERVSLVTERYHMRRAWKILEMLLRQEGRSAIQLDREPAATRDLSAALSEHPVPKRDVRYMARRWVDALRPKMDGTLPLREGAQSALARCRGLRDQTRR
ncbi:MAG: YdcF family protein [Myxococcota bacterium]